MNRVIHFEIHAEDMDRAQKFYESVFGWTFQDMGAAMDNYRVIMTGPGPDEMAGKPYDISSAGINGGMMRRQGPRPAENAPVFGYVCIVGVDDIDAYVKKAEAAGATLALAKMEVPGVGHLAYYKDTEGNIFGMIQPQMPAQK